MAIDCVGREINAFFDIIHLPTALFGFAALLGFNTFWTFIAGNPFVGGIYAPENAEVQH